MQKIKHIVTRIAFETAKIIVNTNPYDIVNFFINP
jgi:hypothetical protein